MGKNNSEALGGPWGGLRHLGAALKCSEAREVWAPRLGFVGLFPAFPPLCHHPGQSNQAVAGELQRHFSKMLKG